MTYKGLVASVLAASSLIAVIEGSAGATSHLKTLPGPKNPPIPSGIKPCADLAAQRIDFSLISKVSQFQGLVRITGVVKNVSPVAYTGAQRLNLFQKNHLVASQDFPHLNLAPGQEVTVAYERDWNASSSSEGEFPPTYMLRLAPNHSTGPDCNIANNQVERSGADISKLFGGAGVGSTRQVPPAIGGTSTPASTKPVAPGLSMDPDPAPQPDKPAAVSANSQTYTGVSTDAVYINGLGHYSASKDGRIVNSAGSDNGRAASSAITIELPKVDAAH
ncbi:MAG: hypothetical protein HYY11_03490 [Candidatus Methylomirabilis oxyfera]|nr:hypothetical protein [Candidatus Methylomirabilis oxyfera]